MQKVRPVQRNLHSTAQQLFEIGLLRPRRQPLVVVFGQDQLHVHARHPGNAQRTEHGFVRHEIRRDQHHLAARQMDHRVDCIACVFERIRRPAGQQLGGDVVVVHRRVRPHVQALPGFGEPVAGEHRFQVIDHRPAHARDQFAIGRAGDKAGCGQVLRADKADLVVDHRNLAVVAQVHAPAAAPTQPAGQQGQHLHATGLQALAITAQATLGAHRIQQQAAAHAACAGAFQRSHHRLAHRIVEHQVIQQMHAFLRLVDRGDQRLQRGLVVVQQFHRIAQRGHEIALPLDQRHHFGAAGIRLRDPAQGVQRQLLLTDHLRGRGLALHALSRQPRVAEQQVQRQANHRHEADQQQPAARRPRRGAGGDPQQRGQADRPVQRQQPGPLQPVRQHRHRVSLRGARF